MDNWPPPLFFFMSITLCLFFCVGPRWGDFSSLSLFCLFWLYNAAREGGYVRFSPLGYCVMMIFLFLSFYSNVTADCTSGYSGERNMSIWWSGPIHIDLHSFTASHSARELFDNSSILLSLFGMERMDATFWYIASFISFIFPSNFLVFISKHKKREEKTKVWMRLPIPSGPVYFFFLSTSPRLNARSIPRIYSQHASWIFMTQHLSHLDFRLATKVVAFFARFRASREIRFGDF